MKSLLKIVKILGISIAGIVVVLIIAGILMSESLPEGQQGEEADALAMAVLKELNYDAYQNTNRISWTFAGMHSYDWFKNQDYVIVTTKNSEVKLDLKNYENSEVISPKDTDEKDLIDAAIKNFNNDSFWLIAPYKLMEDQVERRLITNENGKSLLVTHTSGGSTPGDSYLWKVDENNKPTSFKMWVSIIPIGGLEAKWLDWTTTETDAIISTQKKIYGIPLQITDLKTEF
jgi:hypothetical protein